MQKAIIKTIRPQIVYYFCDKCGERCGTRENPKETWFVTGKDESEHYCKKGCKKQSQRNPNQPVVQATGKTVSKDVI